MILVLGIFLISGACSTPLNSLGKLLDKHLKELGSAQNLTKCQEASLKVIDSAMRIEPWALKMIDATMKLEPGLFTGHKSFLGDIEECLSVSHPDNEFIGQHCLISFDFPFFSEVNPALPKLDVQFLRVTGGVCVPSVCSPKTVVTTIKEILAASETHMVQLESIPKSLCWTRESKDKYRTVDFIFLAIITAIFVLTFVGTIYDCSSVPVKMKIARGNEIFLAFSLKKNGEKLFVTEKEGIFDCIHGIKALSMLAIIYGHTGLHFFRSDSIDRLVFYADMTKWSYIPIHNAHSVTDTFFVMGSIFLALVFLKDIKTKGSYDFPLALIKRYLRLTPTYAFVLLLQIVWPNTQANGTRMFDIARESSCEENWPYILLYIQNYKRMNGPLLRCISYGWYLEADMQLFIISPLLLYPAIKWPKFSAILALVLAITAASYEFYLALMYDFGPAVTVTRHLNDHILKDNFLTHTRSAPWFLGIFLGLIIAKYLSQGDKFKLSKRVNCLSWIFFGGMFFISQFPLFFFDLNYTQPAAALVLAYRRLTWAAGVAWIVLACIIGHGGIVNKILCWRPFVFLSKISYNAYLVHMLLIEIFYNTSMNEQVGQVQIGVSYFLIHCVLTIPVATLMTLTIEQPCRILTGMALRNVEILPLPKNKRTKTE